jgi:hypothetical protein
LKKETFLFKIAIQYASLWHFHICIITQIGSSSLFFSFLLSSLLLVISKGLKILYSLLYRKYINHIHLLNFLLLFPSLLLVISP